MAGLGAAGTQVPLAAAGTQVPLAAGGTGARPATVPAWMVEAGMRRPDGSLVNSDGFLTAGEISGDGRVLLVESSEPGLVAGLDVSPADGWFLPYIVDRQTGKVTMPLVDAQGKVFPNGQGNDTLNMYPSLSADGRWLVIGRPLVSMLPSWVAEQTNPRYFANQFFTVVDLTTGAITSIRTPAVRVGAARGRTSTAGTPSISRDGRYIGVSLFGVRPVGAVSGVENYQGSFRYDRVTGRWLEIVHTADPGGSVGAQLSPDGQWAVVYRSDTGSRWVQQLAGGARWRLPADQQLARAPFSGDSTRLVTKTIDAPDPQYTRWEISTGRVLGRSHFARKIFVQDTDLTAETFVGDVDEPSGLRPSLQNSQVYVCHWTSGECTRVSQGLDGGPAWGGYVNGGSLSDDGTVATFLSNAPNLVPGDVRPTSPFDTRWDVFTAALTG